MKHGWNVWQCILMRCNMGQNQMNSISALGKPILLGLSAGDKLLTSFTSTFNIIGQCISISIIMQIMNHDCLHKIHLMTFFHNNDWTLSETRRKNADLIRRERFRLICNQCHKCFHLQLMNNDPLSIFMTFLICHQ